MRERVSQLYALLVKKVHLQFTSDLRIQNVNFAKHFGQFVRTCT